jgi:uncharacterized protein (TIGR02453 family)
MPFEGFSPKALTFFRQLRKSNTREWFTPRKAFFEEQVRAPMLELVALVNDDLRKFAVDHVHADHRKAVYRLYRDTRFSNDKTPYKDHIGALFPRAGLPKHGGANYYFGVSDKGVEIAAGVYMPEPPELNAIRKAIAEDERRGTFRKLLKDKSLKRTMGELQGEKLSRCPKGYPPEHPAEDLLRFKQLYFYVTLPAKLALEKSVRREIVSRFKLMTPVVEWLNAVCLAAARDRDGEAEPVPVRPVPMF